MKKERALEIIMMVKRGYDDVAADFDATRKKALWPDIYKFAADIKTGDRVLDVACGNGRILEALKDKDFKYLGVDNSEELLTLARQNYPENTFLFSDMLDLKNIPDGEFNQVFCLAALQHIPSRDLRIKALKNMNLKMTNNGRLIVSNWNLWTKKSFRFQLIKRYFLRIFGFYQDDWNDLFFPWKDSSGKNKTLRYYHAFTGKELKKLTTISGFKIKSFYKDKYNFWLELVK